MSVSDWNDHVKRLLKSEMIKRGISSEELVMLLEEIGIHETKAGIDSKISRGKFSATFIFQCLHVLGCRSIEIALPYSMNIAAEPYVHYKSIKE